MKKLTLAAAIVGALTMTTAMTAPSTAMASESFSFSFDTGAVAFAYRDGYYDHNRRWHRWRNSREAREFRSRHRDRYWAYERNRYRNMGWRGDMDRDGVQNAYDRDRDGDGVSNRRDDHPNNPRRD